MKLTNKAKTSHTKRNVFVISAIFLAFVVVTSFYYVYALNGNILGWKKQDTATTGIDLDKPTSSQVKTGDAIKENGLDSNSTDQTDTPPTPTSNNDSTTKTVEVSITTPQLAENNGMYHIGTQISAVVNDGTCNLVLTQGSKIISPPDVGVQAQAKISTCKGYDVTLGKGSWQATLTYTSSTLTGKITSTVVAN